MIRQRNLGSYLFFKKERLPSLTFTLGGVGAIRPGGDASRINMPSNDQIAEEAPPIVFSVVRETAEFSALQASWTALTGRIGSVHLHQTFAWQWRAWTCVAERLGHRLAIVVGRVDGQVVLIWPLMHDGDYLRFLSSEQTEYRDILVEPGPSSAMWLEAAWDTVVRIRGAQCLLLSDVRADAKLTELLARRSPGGYRVERTAWLIKLENYSNWDTYASQRLTHNLVRNQRKRWRRVAQLPGDVRLRMAETPEQIDAVLNWLFMRKMSWLRSRGISTRQFARPEYQDFVRQTVMDAHAAGGLFAGRLGSETMTISASFGYAHEGRYISQSFAYDPEFHTLSPSRLLLETVIRWCFDRGLKEFDFLPGDTAYKADWSDATMAVSEYRVPLTVLGRAKLAWHIHGLARIGRSAWLKTQYHRLPVNLRERLRRRFLVEMDYTAPTERSDERD